MPKVGASQFYAALYHCDRVGNISYSGGCRVARLASWSLTMNNSDDNIDYLDNDEAENAGGTFAGASLVVGIGEFTQKADQLILGTKRGKMLVNGKEVEGMIYNDNLTRPYLGVGFIEKRIVHGITTWWPIILLKSRFNIPDDQVNTQGGTIEWQHDTINASVTRAGTEKGDWKIYDEFSSESQAAAYIRKILNILEEDVETLTLISAEGTAAGTTAITAEPELTEGRSYRYKTGTGLTIPAYGEDLSSWSTWDGVSEITATAGDELILAEVDALGAAMAAGTTTVTVKGE